MMKAVVMEIQGKHAAVLKNDGTFEKIPNKGYAVGDTIEVTASRKVYSFTDRATRIIAAAAAVLLLVTGGAGYNTMVAQAYSYVTVDVNPSIEYTVNRLNRVIDVEALNEEAEEIVNELKNSNIKNKTLTDVMSMTGDLLDESGYISEEDDYILVNITAGNEKHYHALEEEAQSGIEHFRRGEDVVTFSEASKADRRNAKAHNMSTGRYMEVKRIQENAQGNTQENAGSVTGSQDNTNGFDKSGDCDDFEDFDAFRQIPIEELFRRSGRLPRNAQGDFQENPQGQRPEEFSNNAGSKPQGGPSSIGRPAGGQPGQLQPQGPAGEQFGLPQPPQPDGGRT